MEESKEIVRVDRETMISMVSPIIQGMMQPVMNSIADALRQCNEAIQQMAMQSRIQTDRIEALEKQVRLNTPVTPQQVKLFGQEIKKVVHGILEKKDAEEKIGLSGDRKAVTKISGAIRKDIMTRYGVGSLNEIPKCEYSVVISLIDSWKDPITVMEAVKDARERIRNAQN